MYDLAISHLPYKLPLATTVTLLFSLTGIYWLGLMEVQVGKPEPRLLLIFALYLLVIAAIIWMHKKMTEKVKLNFKSSDKISSESYQKKKLLQTESKLKELQRDNRYKQWVQERGEAQESKGSVVYEIVESDSDNEDQQITEHTLATMKKLF